MNFFGKVMEKTGIAKLTNENYDSWKLEVEFLLVREGLWKYVSPGVKPLAASGVTAAELAAWDDGDQKARATIGLLLTRSQYGFIRDTKTAKAAWANLKSQHEKKTLTSKVHLLKRICDLKYNESDDIVEHLQEFEDLFEKLSNAGTKLDKDLQVILVFRSLPSSFDALTTTLENRSPDDLTLELVKGSIINEVQKRKEVATSDSVLKVEGRNSVVCRHCNKTGHKKWNCKLLAKEREEEKARSNNEAKREGKKVSKSQAKAAKSEEHFAFGVSDGLVGKWIVDSGASSHMCANPSFFESLDAPRGDTPESVTVADGKTAEVKGIGSCEIQCYGPGGVTRIIDLCEVLYVPTLDMNLVSVGKLVEKGAKVSFDEKGCTITSGDRVAAVASKSKGLYHLKTVERANAALDQCPKDCVHEWHRKLGHRDTQAVLNLEREELATGIKVSNCPRKITCEPCLQGKMARLPFPKKADIKSEAVLDLIHSDLCGPMNTVTPGGQRYFLTLIDDFSRFTTLYFLQEKSGTVEAIKDFVQAMKTQFGRPPKVIRSDQGGEYRGAELVSFLKSEGIQQQFTTAYTPQQNGVAERKNRSLVEMGRCMILDAGMHYRFWAEALNTANFLQNMLPTRAIQRTPFEMWHKRKPDFKFLHVFGAEAYVLVPKEKRKKLDPKAVKLTLVGYSLQHKAWRFIDPKTSKVVISRDARFLNNTTSGADQPPAAGKPEELVTELPLLKFEEEVTEPAPQEKSDQNEAQPEQAGGGSLDSSEEFNGFPDNSDCSTYEDASTGEEEESEDPTPIQEESDDNAEEEEGRPSAVSRTSDRVTKGIPPERFQASGKSAYSLYKEPRTYNEAISCSESEEWTAAMKDELESHHENGTWDIVPLPPGKKAIGCRWTYKKKLNEQADVVRYKARLVAQGFTQRFGVDYDEVFAPVAKQVTFRILLTIASRRNMVVKHVDVKTAFLNGELKETIYMRVPPGVAAEPNKVCLIRKSLYGLKQSARSWNKKLDKTLKKMGFKQAEADACLYTRNKNKQQSFILVYVDDMIICTQDEEEYREIHDTLSTKFQLVAMGAISHFLGIQVTHTENGYTLNQKACITKMLIRFGLEDAKGSKFPMDPGYIQQKEEENRLPNNEQFQSLIGGLLYLSVNTRPDIGISASILGRKVTKPTAADWTEAKRVLRYLKSTSDIELQLGNSTDKLTGFADADWAGNVIDRKSNSGYIFQLGGGAISWCARKQTCVALSSTEAEYISLAECCQELLWLRKLMRDFGEPDDDPVCIFEDNQSCIKLLSQNSGKRSKHVDTKFHFIKDLAERKEIIVKYCPSEDMLADIMTKPLNRVKLETLREKIGLRPATAR